VNRKRQIEERLTRRRVPEGFPPHAVLPDPEGFTIASIPSFVQTALGVRRNSDPLSRALDAHSAESVLLLIIDGLGYRALETWRGRGIMPTLGRLADRGSYFPITSVFPSTTVTAMTTFSTGLSPLEHGMIGYRLFLRETSRITDMIRLRAVEDGSSELTASNPAIDGLLPAGNLCGRLTASGVSTHVLLPRSIARSGLSQILYKGCSHVEPTVGLADMCVQARKILASSDGPTSVTMYWPGLDAVAHSRGPESESCAAEAASIDTILEHQLLRCPQGALLVVTSDHGFVTMAESDYVELSAFESLADRLVRLPVGEPRASYFHTRDAADARSRLPQTLPGGLIRLGRDAVIENRLLGEGKPHPETLHRLGDEAIIAAGSAAIYHPYPGAPRLRGMHGGLTADEMLVPLIVSPL
jgi:hypothetical protein